LSARGGSTSGGNYESSYRGVPRLYARLIRISSTAT